MVFTSTLTTPASNLSQNLSQQSCKALYPYKRNHYRFEDFFAFNQAEGTLRDWHESRNILASEDFIVALIQGLEKEVGQAASLLMYNIGQEWGKQDATFFQGWFEEQYQQSLQTCRPTLALEAWWWPFTSQGWGNWEVDLENQQNGFMFINIFDSAVARTLGDVGKPVCYLYAGLFAGFFSHLIKKDLSCIETQCYAMGETYCKFLLGKQDRIDAASFWQTEGATARDIEKKLYNGEYLR
ncbi:MAG: 4-vinyl reductase [Acaryochloridaceae cyanobacterium SU_2_1]|nr:4-vinyl reductase [Acaryochloridaceae cyanobacterium SU_2_1]